MTQRAKEMLELADKIEARNPHSINEEYAFNQIQRHLIVAALRLAAQADAPGGLDAATVETCARVAENHPGGAYGNEGKSFAKAIRALASGKKP